MPIPFKHYADITSPYAIGNVVNETLIVDWPLSLV